MNKEQILNEVSTSTWQPVFEFTDDLDKVVDDILEPHEDYFLGLHRKVKEIIEREIDYFTEYHKQCVSAGEPEQAYYQITFADVCNWQKELFEYKKDLIKGHSLTLSNINWQAVANSQSTLNKLRVSEQAIKLPNQHIELGLRTTNVTVGNWTPPHPIFLEELKSMCFPINLDTFCDDLCDDFSFVDPLSIKDKLTEWYKVFETVHYFSDLNGRVGGIVINILSYLLTGKYLINSNGKITN